MTETQRIIDALSSPVRREILWLIWEQELAAGEIAASFDLSAPTISGHLATLRESGLVSLRADGVFRRYRARQDVVSGVRGLLRVDEHKWFPGTTPAPLAAGRTVSVVLVETDASCTQAAAFAAFTDAALYSRWAGVPVSLHDRQFRAEMEWGITVRGTYDHVIEPSLIVMRWDFESEQTPLPGAGQRALLEFFPTAEGCHLVLTQLVESDEQSRYMQKAWGVMLARFRDGVLDAAAKDTGALRPRRRRSTPRRML